MFEASEALHKTEGMKNIHEVETIWISLIGWPNKTSSIFLVRKYIVPIAIRTYIRNS